MATKWTAEDDRNLRKLYAAFSGEVIDVDFVARALDRTPGAVRYRASKLGLAEINRPRAARGRKPAELTRECAECRNAFTLRRPSDKQKFCSVSCGAKQRSRANRGRFGGRGAKVGKRPDLGGMFFRSGWEANYARYLNALVDAGDVDRWEYEPQVFYFPVKRGNKAYLPDFRVWFPDGSYEWHEVKGYMDDASRLKLKRFALHHPAESMRLKLIDKPVYRLLEAEQAHRIEGWE